MFKKKKEKKIYEIIQLKIVIFTAIELRFFESRREKTNVLHICENKDADQLRGNLISAFVFATWIV